MLQVKAQNSRTWQKCKTTGLTGERGEPEVNLEGQSPNAEPDDWFSKAATAASEAGADNQEYGESIADREIKLLRKRAIPQGSCLCPLLE